MENYLNLCVRLRGAPARLEVILRGVSRDLLCAKSGDRWSAQEHAAHLLDLESPWMVRVDDFLANGDTLTVADLTNRKTHKAKHNTRELMGILAESRAARLPLVDRVGKFHPALFARSELRPRLKQSMRLVDHLYFVAEHDDHHLARIWEMINTWGRVPSPVWHSSASQFSSRVRLRSTARRASEFFH